MKFRRFGKLDWEVSVLGFGAMRLPIIGDDFTKINEAESIKMIRYAIDNGVNYVDTAFIYHGGNSEGLVGKALQNGYRKKVKIATKMPTWLVKSQNDMDKCLKTQMKRLNVDFIDFYLLHGLTGERWQALQKLDVLGWAARRMKEGKFGHLGFSFHDDFEVFKNIIDASDDWTFCQILFNYMDKHHEAGLRGLKYAASKGLAVVIMEPLAGGRLAMNPHQSVADLWKKADVKRTPAEWGLLWVWNHPEVTLALSGMSSMKQVKENVGSGDKAEPCMLSKKELNLFEQVTKKYREVGFIQCSGCRYCQPCPNGVDVPKIMTFYNEYFMSDRDDAVKIRYLQQVPKESRAKNCEKCGKCEEVCPQHLPIKDTLNRAAFMFESED